MRRDPRAIAALALLCGCGPSYERTWAGVLVNAPFIYLAGLAVLYMLYGPWVRAYPQLRFGNKSHWATLAVLVALMVWAAPWARFDGVGAYWLFFGSTTVVLWLLIWRIALTWPKSQPFRWSGALAFALSTSPAVAGLAAEPLHEYGEFGVAMWILGSGFGLSLLAALAVLGHENWRLAQRFPPPPAEVDPR